MDFLEHNPEHDSFDDFMGEIKEETKPMSPDDMYIWGARINIEIVNHSRSLSSLSYDEKDAYDYFLTLNLFKKNSKGEDIKPNDYYIVQKILLNHRLMVLHQTVYLYDGKDGTYHHDEHGIGVKHLIKRYLTADHISANNVEAIYKLILSEISITKTDEQINERPKHWIHFKNGYFDYKNERLHEHDPDYYDVIGSQWEYDPNRFPATHRKIIVGEGLCKHTESVPLVFDTVFNAETLGGEENRKMILQYMGYVMTLDTSLQKFLTLVGSGGTGKSTQLWILEEILGQKNISHVPLQDLQDRFSASSLYLKQANICADLPLSALKEIDVLKKCTGEDTVSVDVKYGDRFDFKPFARFVFSANDIPLNIGDRSNAFYRRLMILKMDKPPTNPDPHLKEKLREEIPNIISKIVDELILSGGKVEESTSSKELVKSAFKNSDSVEAFIIDRCEKDKTARIDRNKLYGFYDMYCHIEGRTPLLRANFYRTLKTKGFDDRKTKNGYDFIGITVSNVIPIPTVSDNVNNC